VADDRARLTAVSEIVELGAREAVMTLETGCIALVDDADARGQGEPGRSLFRCSLDPVDAPVSRVGSGDAFLAGYVASRYAGGSAEHGLRFAVACGAESTQHFGAGVVDPKAVERLAADVEVEALSEALEPGG
jgi:1-phosphofructokinase/tagatose 6-phosphate kinase